MLPLFFISLSGHDSNEQGVQARNIPQEIRSATNSLLRKNSLQTSLRLPGSLNDPGVFLQGVP